MGEKLWDGYGNCFIRQEDGTYTEVDIQDLNCAIDDDGYGDGDTFDPDIYNCEFALGLFLNNEQKVLLRKYKKHWKGIYNRMCRKVRREKRTKEKARREKLKNGHKLVSGS